MTDTVYVYARLPRGTRIPDAYRLPAGVWPRVGFGGGRVRVPEQTARVVGGYYDHGQCLTRLNVEVKTKGVEV
jgi:hypothetical protein